MIYICFGMQKSGSTLAYELTRGLLTAMGHPQDRLQCSLVRHPRQVNFINRPDMAAFDRNSLRLIESMAPPPWLVAFKTHGAPSPAVRELAAEGLIIGQANFRDPRDVLPSLLDAGERSSQRGRGSFRGVTRWDDAVYNYHKHLECFEQWADIPGILVTRYEEVAFRSEAFLRRVAGQLGCDDPDALDLPQIVDCVKSTAFTQFNKGRPRRHRDDLSINESLLLVQRFGRQIDAYMGDDLDALDRAFIAAAAQVPAPEPLPGEDTPPCVDPPAEAPPKPRKAKPSAPPPPLPPARAPVPAEIEAFFRRNVLIHTHLEKTAGTSLVRGLQALFGREAVHDLRGREVPRPSAMTLAERGRIRVLSGHFHFGAWERRFGRRGLYLACVRDPYERFCSYHAYVSKRPNHPAYAAIGERSVGEAIDVCIRQRRGAASNYLARYLGGRSPWLRLRQVRSNLENRYLAVVPHDQVHRLIMRIAEEFGLEAPPETVFNAQGGYTVADENKARFMAHNALDYRVLDYINSRYGHWLDTFSQRLARLSDNTGR